MSNVQSITVMTTKILFLLLIWTISESCGEIFVDFEHQNLEPLSTKCGINTKTSYAFAHISQLGIPIPNSGDLALITSNGCLESDYIDVEKDFLFELEYLYFGNGDSEDTIEIIFENNRNVVKQLDLVPSIGKWKTFRRFFRNTNDEKAVKVRFSLILGFYFIILIFFVKI